MHSASLNSNVVDETCLITGKPLTSNVEGDHVGSRKVPRETERQAPNGMKRQSELAGDRKNTAEMTVSLA